MELPQSFDFAVMIYCDYGALSADGRKNIMDRVYRQLKPGGCFVLDVFSMAAYHHFRNGRPGSFAKAAASGVPANIPLSRVIINTPKM